MSFCFIVLVCVFVFNMSFTSLVVPKRNRVVILKSKLHMYSVKTFKSTLCNCREFIKRSLKCVSENWVVCWSMHWSLLCVNYLTIFLNQSFFYILLNVFVRESFNVFIHQGFRIYFNTKNYVSFVNKFQSNNLQSFIIYFVLLTQLKYCSFFF